jgi:hypothetical protein
MSAGRQVFETDNVGERAAENGFVKVEGFFGISIEVDVRVDQCHS